MRLTDTHRREEADHHESPRAYLLEELFKSVAVVFSSLSAAHGPGSSLVEVVEPIEGAVIVLNSSHLRPLAWRSKAEYHHRDIYKCICHQAGQAYNVRQLLKIERETRGRYRHKCDPRTFDWKLLDRVDLHEHLEEQSVLRLRVEHTGLAHQIGC